MQNNRSHLVSAGQIHCRNGSDTLAIQNDILRTDSVSRAQRMPGGIDVGVHIFLGRFAGAGTVARVIVAEDVAVNALAESDEEAGHLAEIDGVAVREEERESIMFGLEFNGNNKVETAIRTWHSCCTGRTGRQCGCLGTNGSRTSPGIPFRCLRTASRLDHAATECTCWHWSRPASVRRSRLAAEKPVWKQCVPDMGDSRTDSKVH